MDQQFTDSIRQWLSTPREHRDVAAGAQLLLRLTGNRHIARLAEIRPDSVHDHIEQDLAHHLAIREEGYTIEEVNLLDRRLMPAMKELFASESTISAPGGADAPPAADPASDDEIVAEQDGAPHPHRGRRPDHESLPASIQKIYERGGVLWDQMRVLYERLLAAADAAPCDRFEDLHQLHVLFDEYVAGWKTYDNYKAEEDLPAESAAPSPENAAPASLDDSPEGPAETARSVDSLRKQLSRVLVKIEKAPGNISDQNLNELRSAASSIAQTLIDMGVVFSSPMSARLQTAGIVMDLNPAAADASSSEIQPEPPLS